MKKTDIIKGITELWYDEGIVISNGMVGGYYFLEVGKGVIFEYLKPVGYNSWKGGFEYCIDCCGGNNFHYQVEEFVPGEEADLSWWDMAEYADGHRELWVETF